MAGFWAGFGPAMADRINSRRDAMEARAAQRRQYLTEEGYKRRAQRNELVQTVTTSASYLSNLGMDEDRIKYLVENDPNGLLTLAAKTQKANESGQSRLTGTDLNSAVTMLEDQKIPAGSLSDVIENRFETFMRVQKGEKPTRSGANLFAAMLGYGDDEINAVYEKDLIDGYTGADIAASLDRPIMDTSGIGSANIDYRKISPSTMEISEYSAIAKDVTAQIADSQERARAAVRRDDTLSEAEKAKKLLEIDTNPNALPEVVDLLNRYEAAQPSSISANPVLPMQMRDAVAADGEQDDTDPNKITTTILPPMGAQPPAAPVTPPPAAPVTQTPDSASNTGAGFGTASRKATRDAARDNAADVANATPTATPDAANLPPPTPEQMRAAPVFPDVKSFWEAYNADPETVSTYEYIRIGATGVVYINQFYKGTQ